MKVSKKGFKPKRVGSKAAKALEFESKGEILNNTEATLFRALAARANYLAMERPECAYATKELCRFFATPTKTGVEQLKRLIRYIAGAPRLVWKFGFHHSASADELKIFVDTDLAGCHVTRRSTAAIGIARRRGLGKVRHLATADLWIQDRIRKGDFALVKVAGADNTADILTKNVDKPLLLKHMETLGLSVQEGRAESAPAIAE